MLAARVVMAAADIEAIYAATVSAADPAFQCSPIGPTYPDRAYMDRLPERLMVSLFCVYDDDRPIMWAVVSLSGRSEWLSFCTQPEEAFVEQAGVAPFDVLADVIAEVTEDGWWGEIENLALRTLIAQRPRVIHVSLDDDIAVRAR